MTLSGADGAVWLRHRVGALMCFLSHTEAVWEAVGMYEPHQKAEIGKEPHSPKWPGGSSGVPHVLPALAGQVKPEWLELGYTCASEVRPLLALRRRLDDLEGGDCVSVAGKSLVSVLPSQGSLPGSGQGP